MNKWTKLSVEAKFYILQIFISVACGLLFYLAIPEISERFISSVYKQVEVTEIPILKKELQTVILYIVIAVFSLCALLGNILFFFISRPVKEVEKALQSFHKICSPASQEILHRMTKSSDRPGEMAKAIEFLTHQIVSYHHSSAIMQEEKKAILESLWEGIIIVDQQMHVRDLNGAAVRFFQLGKKDCITKKLEKLEAKKNHSLLDACRQLVTISLKEMRVVRDFYSYTDAQKHYLELVVIPKAYRDGAIIVLQDKSSHRKTIEVGKDFVANASHELRTPITIIRGFAETLQDFPELSREMFQEIIDKMLRNCQRMETLVQNLLTLADIEHLPESRFRECDLLQLFSRIRETILTIYPQTIFSMSCDEPISLCADFELLELAITNLFDNAVKYSPSPARIEFDIKKKKEDILITIKDHGIGIPQSDIKFIFDRFYTVDKTHSRKLGGAGLGLSLVKTIIEKHDGSISASSKLGEGTTFTILLPIKKSVLPKIATV